MTQNPEYPTLQPVELPALDQGSLVPTLVMGFLAALVGGGIWAAVVLFMHVEVGWLAWGVGVLVGLAMAWSTGRRGQILAMTAGGLAAVGLVIGKILITLGSAGALATEILDDTELMAAGAAWELYSSEGLTSDLQEEVSRLLSSGDPIPDAVWYRMVEEGESRLEAMTDQELRDTADRVARGMVLELGLISGILIQLSLWDLLWFGLAVITAFQIMSGLTSEEVEGM